MRRRSIDRPTRSPSTFGNRSLTYRELNERSNQLARYLQAIGFNPAAPIGIYLDRSIEMLVALLATLKAGGTYLPLDPAYPAERLNFMLQDAQVERVLTRSLPPLPTVRSIDLAAESDAIARHSSENLPAANQSIAYLLYTSGSTGTPKAVQILHKSLSNFLLSMRDCLRVTAHDRLLAVTTIAFDIAALELFLPLIVGAEVVIAAREVTSDGMQLAALLDRHSVNLIQATPATWRLLLASGWQGKRDLKILCGGEALDRALATNLLNCAQQVWNLYGPTETTIWSAALQVAEEHLETATVPIGEPIANTQLHILDRHLQPVAIGVPGELYISGTGLAHGYLNRPDLTGDRFLPHASGRLYRTGDRVRRLANGAIEYLGRLDHQVKLRSYRIELGEIEAVLRQHPDVDQAIVLLEDDRLVAYLVPGCPAEVRLLIQRQLPSYMIPSAFVELAAFPLTPNGKIDRQALRELSTVQAIRSTSIAPRNAIEAELAEIWAIALGLESVGVEDDFFALGGHSLLATRVVAQIREAFGVELPLRQLFETPTIAQIALTLDQSRLALPAIEPVERSGVLSFAQQRQWVLAQLEPHHPAYLIPAAIRIQGGLDVQILHKCFIAVVERHEVLRTAIHTIEGQPVPVAIDHPPVELPLIDLTALPMPETQMQQFVSQNSIEPIAIDRAPLLRLRLLRLSAIDHVLLLTLHHIAADGWSINLLIREVIALYDALIQGKPAALPELPIQYADFAQWQRQWLQGEPIDRQLAYWRSQLQDAPPLLELPIDRPRPAVQTGCGQSHKFEINPATSRALQQVARQAGCTLFMTLLAAFQILLSRYSDRSDILVGTPIANRTRRETELLIGCFANTLVLRTDLSGNPTVLELLRRVKQVALDAYTHQDLPFEQLVDALQPERSLSYSPLFQVMFLFSPLCRPSRSKI
ncbi:MAG: amino acid adenylation domain-containing protein [Leptolyngbyaceae cyanobacterium SM1_3_5]|nr:amino acid adenylation domain-containing protein [Leptolyngbyaceae cyanobacterium SM1_3_5]